MTDKTATLGLDGTNHSYPILEGSWETYYWREVRAPA